MIEFPELPPPTGRVGDLTEAEQVVLGCFRRWLSGPTHREMLERSLAYELTPGEARAAMKGLEATIRVLSAHASRNIRYHHPCCPAMAPDEVGLISLVAAVQRRQSQLADLVAERFVAREGVRPLLAATAMFAAALEQGTIRLPLRFAYCESGAAEAETTLAPAAPTLH